jgi:kynurenine formamidase
VRLHLIDLSHAIEAGMPRFPGLASPTVTPLWTHGDSPDRGYHGTTCELTRIEMVTSVGTYLDAPFHFDPDGLDISQLSLDQLVLPGLTIDIRDAATAQTALPVSMLQDQDIEGKALLLNTGWSDYWGDDRYGSYPFVSFALAAALRAARPALVGIDALMIDDPRDMTRPAHTLLLHAGILIVENLTGLAQLAGREFTFVAAPVRVAAAAFPVRAFAIVHGDR